MPCEFTQAWIGKKRKGWLVAPDPVGLAHGWLKAQYMRTILKQAVSIQRLRSST